MRLVILTKSFNAKQGKWKGGDESIFDAKELDMGIRVEMEHTTDKYVAKQLALDHLAENPHYYSTLKRAGLADELKKSYKLQGHTTFQGLKIAIENKKGTYRCGVDPNGKPWKTFMHYSYGYIQLTEGPDGDAVDVYIGPNKQSEKVFVVHQVDPFAGYKYDEDKVMLGFDSRASAKRAYQGQYNRKDFFGTMEEWNIHDFVSHLRKKKTFLTGVR